MQITYFEKNRKNQWNEFIAENCSESFLQSWEWGNFQENLGRKIWRMGIIDNNLSNEDEISNAQIPNPNCKLFVIALIVKHNLPFGKNYLYCPRGPVISQKFIKSIKPKVHKVEILDLLFNEIKKIAKKEGAIFLRIDPPAELNNESGIMNYEYLFNLKKSSNEIQPRDTLILDLTKSEKELLKEMKQKTRYNIKLAEKKKLRITNYELRITNREIFKEKFEKFWELMEETSKRDGFKSHSRDYYWKMLENLGFYNDSGKNCHSEFSSETIDYKSLNCSQFVKQDMRKIVQDVGGRKKIPKQSFDFAQDDFVQDDNQKLWAKLYLAEYENKIIAANIVLYFGDLAVYLHGASSGEHRNLMAPYLLQWRQILDAKKIGCKKYDFWGINSSKSQIPNPKSQAPNNSKFQIPNSKFQSWSGITRFKKGFGGEEKNYIGAYDMVFDNIGYVMYKFVKSFC